MYTSEESQIEFTASNTKIFNHLENAMYTSNIFQYTWTILSFKTKNSHS